MQDRALILCYPHRRCLLETEHDLQEGIDYYCHRYNGNPAAIMTSCQSEFQTELARVRKNFSSVYLLTWRDNSGKICNFAEGFGPHLKDRIILSGIRVEGDQCYDPDDQSPNYYTIFEQITENNLLVAGFHFTDCVPEFTLQARRRGRLATIAPCLTDAYHYNARRAYINGDVPQSLPEEINIRKYKQLFARLTLREFDWWFPPHRYRRL